MLVKVVHLKCVTLVCLVSTSYTSRDPTNLLPSIVCLCEMLTGHTLCQGRWTNIGKDILISTRCATKECSLCEILLQHLMLPKLHFRKHINTVTPVHGNHWLKDHILWKTVLQTSTQLIWRPSTITTLALEAMQHLCMGLMDSCINIYVPIKKADKCLNATMWIFFKI